MGVNNHGYFDDLESGNIPDDGWCNKYCLAQLIYDICDDGEDNETILKYSKYL